MTCRLPGGTILPRRSCSSRAASPPAPRRRRRAAAGRGRGEAAHRRSRYRASSLRVVTILFQQSPQRGAASRRPSGAWIESRSPGKLNSRPAAAVGRLGVEVDEADGLLLRAAARPGDAGDGDGDVDAEPSRAPRAIASATSAETAPCSSISAAGTPSCSILTSFAYETIPPSDHVATSRAPRSAAPRPGRPCRTPRSRACRPRSRQRSSTISSTARPSVE